MRRREKFLISSLLLTFGLLGTQLVPVDFRSYSIILMFFIAYAISSWALAEDLDGVEWLTVVPLPGVFAVATAFFYFLLPTNIWSRGSILTVFGVGVYALFLTGNIYTVAKTRTIQLLRAAHAIGLLFVLISALLFSNTIYAYHWPFYVSFPLFFVLFFVLSVHVLWSMKLEKHISKKVVFCSVIVSLLSAVFSSILWFMPATVWSQSLYLLSFFYVWLGILTTSFEGRLFKNTIWEFISVFGVMTAIFFYLLSWK